MKLERMLIRSLRGPSQPATGRQRHLSTGIRMFLVAVLTQMVASASHGHPGDSLPEGMSRHTGGDPGNRCELTVMNRVGALPAALTVAEQENLLDQDIATGVRIDGGERAGVEVLFQGAPRWISRVEAVCEPGLYVVEVLDLDREWRFYATGEFTVPSAGPLALHGTASKVLGLRLLRAEPGAWQLSELGAWFSQSDPDDGGSNPLSDTGGPSRFHYDWCNDYPGSSNDLNKCDDDAVGAWNGLPSAWDLFGGHGNSNAKEIHFKRNDIGDGDNGGHVDGADLGYYAGHGDASDYDSYYGEDLTSLAWCTSDDDDDGLPSDSRACWGDGDMEWVAMAACWILESPSRGEWANAFNGAHLICGAATTIPDYKFGITFSDRLVDNGSFDTAKTVKSSWFDAIDRGIGANLTAVVIGENSSMGNDYIWGEGSVASDPVVDGSYSSWSYNTGAAAGPGGGAPAPDIIGPPAPESLVRFPALAERGFAVSIEPAVLNRDSQAEMPVYNVIPATVDSAYVRQIANRFCQINGRFCGAPLGPGDPGEVNVIDGAHELRVTLGTGSIHYENTARWLTWRNRAPRLLLDESVVDRASEILTALQRRPADAIETEVSYLWQELRLKDDDTADPDSSFAVATRVAFRRELGTGEKFPVVGPGGVISVALGQDGELQRIFEGGWRRLIPGGTVPLMPLEAAIEALNRYGWDAAVEELRTRLDEIIVLDWELGYYEPAADVNTPRITPVYILHCLISHEGDATVPADIYVWADRMRPRAEVITPGDGTPVLVGAEVCFEGDAEAGVEPYQFRWTDDLGRLLGEGPSICARFPAPPDTGDGSADWVRTVELSVIDARGREGTAFVTLILEENTSGTPERAQSQHLTLARSSPNPFRDVTLLRFELPGSERVPTSLRVFDASGRLVRTLIDAPMTGGSYQVLWDGRDERGKTAAAGVYFSRLQRGGGTSESRLLLVR